MDDGLPVIPKLVLRRHASNGAKLPRSGLPRSGMKPCSRSVSLPDAPGATPREVAPDLGDQIRSFLDLPDSRKKEAWPSAETGTGQASRASSASWHSPCPSRGGRSFRSSAAHTPDCEATPAQGSRSSSKAPTPPPKTTIQPSPPTSRRPSKVRASLPLPPTETSARTPARKNSRASSISGAPMASDGNRGTDAVDRRRSRSKGRAVDRSAVELEGDVVRWSSVPEDLEGCSGLDIAPELHRLSLVRRLARKHAIEAQEVQRILTHLDNACGGAHGDLLNRNGFRQALSAMYNFADLNEKGVQSAWERFALSGEVKENNGLRDLDVGGFIAWHASEQKWAVLKTYTVWRETEESLRELAQANRVTAAALKKVKLVFDEYDLNHSGIMDYLEFESMLRKRFVINGRFALSEARVKLMWQEVDSTDIGTLDFPEFAKWYLDNFDIDTEEFKGILVIA